MKSSWDSKLSIKLKKICSKSSCKLNKFDPDRKLIRTIEETGLCASCYKKREAQLRKERADATVKPMLLVKRELARREFERKRKQEAVLNPNMFHDLEEFF